jgi:tRNA (guanine-N7-)-methyltransferase
VGLKFQHLAQKKLFRFGQLSTFKNVFEYPDNIAGNWKDFFGNENPVILELACGRGEYTVGLASMDASKNYIGVDVKGNRMYIGAKKALDEKLANAGFLRTQIEKLDLYFIKGEVDEIWITFPDPQLRLSKAKKRLTHPRFLRLYANILKEGGRIHLKTDSPDLYQFTLQVCNLYEIPVIEKTDDVYGQPDIKPELKIKTHYESLDIAGSKKIHYISFCLPEKLPDLDEKLKELLNATID